MSWDGLPTEIQSHILYLRGQIYPNAARKIQDAWTCYLAPKKVAIRLAYEQLPPALNNSLYDVSSLPMVLYLEYFVKVLSGRERSYVWVLFLDHIQDDLWLYDHLLFIADLFVADEYMKRSEDAYKILRNRFGYLNRENWNERNSI